MCYSDLDGAGLRQRAGEGSARQPILSGFPALRKLAFLRGFACAPWHGKIRGKTGRNHHGGVNLRVSEVSVLRYGAGTLQI